MDTVDPLDFHNLALQLRDEKTGVPMKASLLGFRKLTKTFQSKDILAWISKNIDYFRDAPNEEMAFFVQLLVDRKYVFNSLDQNNMEFQDNTKANYRFREVVPMTAMGRGVKHYFIMSDIDTPKYIKSVMTIVKKSPMSRIIQNERDGKAFCAFMNNVKHPCLMDIDHCEYDTDNFQAILHKRWSSAGSLRDLIFKATPNVEYQIKYAFAKGLTLHEISLYGRQILKGISALISCGMPVPHLHSGNILIDGKRFECRFTDLENVFLGRPVQHLLHFDPNLSIELQCFAHVLYEMASGKRLEDNILPTECKIEPIVYEIIAKIFKGALNIDSLLFDPFFYKKGDMDVKPIYIKDSAMLSLIEKAAMEIRGEQIPDAPILDTLLFTEGNGKQFDSPLPEDENGPTTPKDTHSKSLELKYGFLGTPQKNRQSKDYDHGLPTSPQRSPMPLKESLRSPSDHKLTEKVQKMINKTKKEEVVQEVIEVEEF
jgi:serine/threonine protein kinase